MPEKTRSDTKHERHGQMLRQRENGELFRYKEKLYKMDTTKMTTDEVKSVIYRYIHYYNLRRIYTTNGGLPPMEKRRQYFAKTIAA